MTRGRNKRLYATPSLTAFGAKLVRNLFLCTIVLAGWLITTPALAVPFTGSDPLGSTGGNVDASVTLTNTDVFSINNVVASTGTGDFLPVPNFHGLNPNPVTIDFNNLAGLTLTDADWGTFTALTAIIVSRTATHADIFLTGKFDNSTAAGGSFAYANFTASGGDSASFEYAMTETGTETGNSISWSGTLAVPSAEPPSGGVPEPSTFVLAAAGLAGLGLVVWRRGRPAC